MYDVLRDYTGVAAKFYVIGDANDNRDMQSDIRDAYSNVLLI